MSEHSNNSGLKPAKRVIAKARPTSDGFEAQFALPGMAPDLVCRGGLPVVYPTETDATNAACQTVVAMLQSRTSHSRVVRGYRLMTPAEFAVALTEIDITATYFAEIVGVHYDRIMKWIDGEADVPHYISVILALIRYDMNFKVAREVTEKAQEVEA